MQPVRDRYGFELRMAAQLPEEVADVVSHSRLREAEMDRDLPGRDAMREQLQHLVLARAQAPCGYVSLSARGRGPAAREDLSPLHLERSMRPQADARVTNSCQPLLRTSGAGPRLRRLGAGL